MPDVEMLVIGGIAWATLAVLAITVCVAAGRSDRRMRPARAAPISDEHQAASGSGTAAGPVVADTGGIRAQLRAASSLLDAAQLTLSVDIDGTDAVLATTRSVALVQPEGAPGISAPVIVGDREIGRLRAVRRHDAAPFDDADRQLLRALAARLATTMEVADPSRPVPLRRSGAMA